MCVQTVKDIRRPALVPLGRLLDRHQRRHPLGSRWAAVAEGDLAKYHQRPQRTLGQIVGRWNSGIIQKDQPLAGMFANPALQRERFLMVQRAGFQSR